MGRKVLQGWSVFAAVVLAGGCFHERGMLAADPDLLKEVARSGGQDEPVTRAQKPDATAVSRTLTPLDLPPERTTEVSNVPPIARIRVTVNGEAILDEEIKAACYDALMATRDLPESERAKKQAELWYAARDQLIDREVVLQDAFTRLSSNPKATKFLDELKKAATKEFNKSVVRRAAKEAYHLKSNEEFKDLLHSRGMSLEMLQRGWERNFMCMEYLRSRIFNRIENVANHKAVVEYYETHPEEFQTADMVDWQDIVIDPNKHPSREAARRFAEVLAARARAGQDFVKLAEQFDNGDSSVRGNAAGEGHKKGEIRPADVEAILFRLKDGEVGPVVELPTSFHIIRLVKRNYAGMQPFDEKIQKAIKEKLRNEVGQREMKKIVAELRRKAIIEYSRATD